MTDADRALARWAKEDGGVRFECRPRGWSGLAPASTWVTFANARAFARVLAVDEVTGELRRWADEDGGVLFHCRPRGWPPGRFGRFVVVVLVLWPHAMAWSFAGWLWLKGDADLIAWQLLPGPGWGPESPLFPGVVIPWLVLGGTCLLLGELVGLARYRSRRIVVTPRRVLVAQGVFTEWIEGSGRVGLPEVVVEPGGVKTWASGWVALGRLDPLDLQDLVRALDAPAPRVKQGFWRWPALLLATLVFLACGPALGLLPPLLLVGSWVGWKVRRRL